MNDKPMKVLVVEPMRQPRVQEIDGSLASMQAVVGGDITATYPFDDAVALIYNDMGKLEGLPPNRLLYDDNGAPYDMVCGAFFLAGLGNETYASLPEEYIQKYKKHFGRYMIFSVPQYPIKNHQKKKEKNHRER